MHQRISTDLRQTHVLSRDSPSLTGGPSCPQSCRLHLPSVHNGGSRLRCVIGCCHTRMTGQWNSAGQTCRAARCWACRAAGSTEYTLVLYSTLLPAVRDRSATQTIGPELRPPTLLCYTIPCTYWYIEANRGDAPCCDAAMLHACVRR